MSPSGLGEGASNHAVVQVKGLVDERGPGVQQDRDQRGLPTFDLQILQMVNGGLGAFPRQPKQVIGVDATSDFGRETNLGLRP